MAFLGERSLLRRTWPAGTYVGGVFVRPAPVDSPIRGTWRPMPPKQVEKLEASDRARVPRALVTKTRLQTVEQGTGLVSDHVSPDGGANWWELMEDADAFPDNTFKSPINHYSYRLLKLKESDG